MNRLLILPVALAMIAGCAPTSGVVTGTTGPQAPSQVPDIQYVSAKGEQTTFNKARYPVAVVAFSAPEGANCCWLDPKVIQLSDQVWNLPITVAQVSEPKGECPHGKGCMEACNLNKSGLISLCDASHVVWTAFGKPEPGALILIDGQGKVVAKSTINEPDAVMKKAQELANAQYKPDPRLEMSK